MTFITLLLACGCVVVGVGAGRERGLIQCQRTHCRLPHIAVVAAVVVAGRTSAPRWQLLPTPKNRPATCLLLRLLFHHSCQDQFMAISLSALFTASHSVHQTALATEPEEPVPARNATLSAEFFLTKLFSCPFSKIFPSFLPFSFIRSVTSFHYSFVH